MWVRWCGSSGSGRGCEMYPPPGGFGAKFGMNKGLGLDTPHHELHFYLEARWTLNRGCEGR
jgi:hypothetical protein